MEVSDYIQQLQVLQDKNGSVEVLILDKENNVEYSLNEMNYDLERNSIIISIGLGQIGIIPVAGPPPGGLEYINRIESGSTGNMTPEEIIAKLKARQNTPSVPEVSPVEPDTIISTKKE